MRKIVLFAALFGIAHHVKAQDNNELIQYYDSSVVTASYSFGGMSLSHQGHSSSTWLGVSKSMKNVLGHYEDSKKLCQNYQNYNAFGNVLMLGGLAATLVGQSYLQNGVLTKKYDQGLQLVLVGTLSELIGAFVLMKGYSELMKSVNAHNRNRMSDYKK